MNSVIDIHGNYMQGIYPRVEDCAIGVVIRFEGSLKGSPASITVELTNYSAIQMAKNLVQAAENHAKNTNKSVEYFRRQLNRRTK